MTAVPAAGPLRDRAAGLLLGARLTVGGRRASWGRLVLTVVGIAVGVLVLLFAASANHLVRVHGDRADALIPAGDQTPPVGVDPLYVRSGSDEYRRAGIAVSYLRPGGPHAPLPPGVGRLPGPGEAVLSPALASLLSTPDAELLRARYPQRVVGTIGRAGLLGPDDARIYLGSADLEAAPVYRFGLQGTDESLPPLLWALLVVGVVVLLFPVFVFVAASARLADAERDRRLGTFRLIGASSAQVRWIAAGESLLAAAVGLAAGAGMFLAGRPLVEGQSISGVTPFATDVTPAWPLVALIVVAVPALAVGSALFALRRTLVEPLGVVRQAGTARRRLWWRLLPTLAGVAVLGYLIRSGQTHFSDRRPLAALVAGVVLILLGIPTVLPWLLQRSLRRSLGPTLALQLATGRLRQDSGTPARVVSGIGVVVAGAISLSSLLAAADLRYGPPAPQQPSALVVELTTPAPETAGTVAMLRRLPGVQGTELIADSGGAPSRLIGVRDDPADPDVADRVRVAVAPLAWRANVFVSWAGPAGDQREYLGIRRGLFAGALLTLLLAGATLLAAAVDQVRQRRRPLAALAASGVPRSMLARSLLWQTAIPVLLGVLVADVTGIVLGTLVAWAVDVPPAIDWAGVAAFSAAALGIVAVVTGLTLPAVRQATRPTALRSE
jgi:FtsX-like permease family